MWDWLNYLTTCSEILYGHWKDDVDVGYCCGSKFNKKFKKLFIGKAEYNVHEKR